MRVRTHFLTAKKLLRAHSGCKTPKTPAVSIFIYVAQHLHNLSLISSFYSFVSCISRNILLQRSPDAKQNTSLWDNLNRIAERSNKGTLWLHMMPKVILTRMKTSTQIQTSEFLSLDSDAQMWHCSPSAGRKNKKTQRSNCIPPIGAKATHNSNIRQYLCSAPGSPGSLGGNPPLKHGHPSVQSCTHVVRWIALGELLITYRYN